MLIAEGIHKVDGVRVSNAYLVEIADGLMAVDTGMRGNTGHILTAVEALGRKPEDLRVIVLTHWHMDHMGSAAELRRRTGAKVAIHEVDAPILAGGQLPPKGRRLMGLIMRLMRVEHLRADVELHDGDELGGFRIVHVPGHTAGSVMLFRDGVAFTGDALLGDGHGHILPPNASLSLDPAQATASAEEIKSLRPSLVLPGHGRPAQP
jgi:glyoxylase-like metal-dependent hydrolase (beta-lactamase superfamily II)